MSDLGDDINFEHDTEQIEEEGETQEERETQEEDEMENELYFAEDDPDYEPETNRNKSVVDPYPGTEKKRKIVEYWLNAGGKKRIFSSVQNTYKKLSNIRQLQRWQVQLNDTGIFEYLPRKLSKS